MKDAFISYARLDDVPPGSGQTGWIARFQHTLSVRLNSLRGQVNEIWWDPNLEGDQVFAQTIETQLRQVKALISVTSPRYYKSDWCRREVLAFLAAAEATGGFVLGDRARLFKVLKTPVPEEDLPADLPPALRDLHRQLLGYAFYDLDPKTQRPREFSPEFGSRAARLFQEKVYDLAWQLCRLLNQFDKDRPAAPKPEGEPKTVYLAEGTSDVEGVRDRVRRELLERGHVVLPDQRLPAVASEVRRAVEDCLARSDLAVHCVGGVYGVIPEGPQDWLEAKLPQGVKGSLGVIQNVLAARRAGTGRLRRLIWMPPDLRPSEDLQIEFVRILQTDPEAQRGADLIQGTLDQLKELLLDRLRPPPPTPAPLRSAPTAARPAPLVYVIGDPADREAMKSLDRFLFDGGVEVTRSYGERSASELAEAHQRRLLDCDAALIYYGSTSRDWVDMKLMDLRQAPGYGRDRAFRACAVCVAPPGTPDKAEFRSRAADVIQLGDPLEPGRLSPFLEKVSAEH